MNKVFLTNLLTTFSPSGYEEAACTVFEDEMKKFSTFEFHDEIGNSCFSVGNGKTKIMLSGHIDEIALQVQYIDDKGFIYFIKDGGTDPKAILASRVTIIGKGGKLVNGVIGKMPIHVEFKSDAKDKATKIEEMKIDIGCTSKEDAMKLVEVGNPIIVGHIEPIVMGDRIVSRGLDDKIGVFIVSEVLKALSKLELKNVKVYGVACTQEEVGGNGAHLAAKRIDPKYSIDYDVTFATDDDYVSPKEWGDIKLGKGGAIAFGTDNSPRLTNMIKESCEGSNIPFQTFSVRSGGTDTLPIKKAASNALTSLISIPNRNMHTEVEMCDFNDVQSIIDMTIATILRIEQTFNIH